MRDLIMILCARGPQKVFTFIIDPMKGHFFKEISRHEDKLTCQNIYFQHYAANCPQLLKRPDELEDD